MPNSELLTSPQVAGLLGCSLRTVHRLAAAELLRPAHKLPGPNGAFLFTEDDVQDYQRNRENAA
jgi:DNA-binding transcriptional MerR regulator